MNNRKIGLAQRFLVFLNQHKLIVFVLCFLGLFDFHALSLIYRLFENTFIQPYFDSILSFVGWPILVHLFFTFIFLVLVTFIYLFTCSDFVLTFRLSRIVRRIILAEKNDYWKVFHHKFGGTIAFADIQFVTVVIPKFDLTAEQLKHFREVQAVQIRNELQLLFDNSSIPQFEENHKYFVLKFRYK